MKRGSGLVFLCVLVLMVAITSAEAWEFSFKNNCSQTITWKVYGNQWGTKAHRCTIITGPGQTGPQNCGYTHTSTCNLPINCKIIIFNELGSSRCGFQTILY